MKFLGVLTLAVLVLFAGCASQQPAASPQQPGQETGNGLQGGTAGSQPPAQNAEAEFNDCISNICGPGNDNFTKICRVSCWDDYAVATKDSAKCSKNIELINSSIGYSVCIGAVSKAAKDPAPCGLLKTEFDRDLCYLELAQYMDDPSICDYVKDENVILTKQDCLNSLNSD
ncbi:MAG: hypothetical protein AB1324_05950 [Candidatus Micrarchaeota archaeon]